MISLSELLRERREALGLSFEDVSEQTRIRPSVIQALEEGNYSLFEPTYVRSFLKTYAAFLKVPESKVEELLSQKSASAKAEEPEGEGIGLYAALTALQSKPKPKMKLKVGQPNVVATLVYTALFLSAAAIFYYFILYDRSASRSMRADGALLPPSGIANQADSGSLGNLLDQFTSEEVNDSISLEISSMDSAWVSLTIDGKRSDEFVVYPGVVKRWNAFEYFKLTVANAGMVELRRNGVVLPKLGKPGTVVRDVKITKTDIQTSAQPYKPQRDTVPVPAPPPAGTQRRDLVAPKPASATQKPQSAAPKPQSAAQKAQSAAQKAQNAGQKPQGVVPKPKLQASDQPLARPKPSNLVTPAVEKRKPEALTNQVNRPATRPAVPEKKQNALQTTQPKTVAKPNVANNEAEGKRQVVATKPKAAAKPRKSVPEILPVRPKPLIKSTE